MAELERRTLGDRTYWMAPGAPAGAPLLLALPGTGMDGPRLASWSGLADRGPAAGFATVFPEAHGMWDDTGAGRVDGGDDVAFVQALVRDFAPERLFLAGLSNGASFAERLARHGLVKATGIVLVAGSARAASRAELALPAQRAALLCFAGTKDRMAPYAGGRASGIMGSLARRRVGAVLHGTKGRESIAIETVATDWATVNGCSRDPLLESGLPGGVDRLTWTGRPPVTVYRVNGGGHGWPGGPQFAPRFLVGEVRQSLDATGILLEFLREASAEG